MIRVLSWPKKAWHTLADEGFKGLLSKLGVLVDEFKFRLKMKAKKKTRDSFYDVLFINGCDYSVPHPIRYRVDHQMEQLNANGISSGTVFYKDLTIDDARKARNFIIFRCPYTDVVGSFIERAKKLNKRVYFDVDDLVIDTRYTDEIPYLDTMSAEERSQYNRGVNDMGKTLSLCDAAITTTEALAEELKHYVPEVFINRNTASETMLEHSQKAIYNRDTLPHLPIKQVPRRERKRYKELISKTQKRDTSLVTIGYFSGSITHNDDFNFIIPVLMRVMDERPGVRLRVLGDLDLPSDLELYRDRIQASSFVSWERLPDLISQVDINLAPLTETIFNKAKSENKWVEAALVKVPTIASDIGAFSHMIDKGKTGLLCKTQEDWYEALIALVDNRKLRLDIAAEAYDYCMKNCLTINSGYPLAQYIRKNQASNVAMVVPSLKTSGGILVMLKHCVFLQNAGNDVFILNTEDKQHWVELDGHFIPVLNRVRTIGQVEDTPIEGRIDKGVATYWDTLDFLEKYPNVSELYYLVQNYETDFYAPPEELRQRANATYSKNVKYLTISKWCEDWLKKDFDRKARFASNGIDAHKFWPENRDFSQKKIRILVEGDFSAHKNVDEAFQIVDKLDPEKFEIWYMSYMPKPKDFYRIDNFLGAVPPDEVSDVYRSCHILLKTSILESFSYPPLEMMSTGGYVVVLPNDGNREYLEDELNCLFYDRGNLDQAVDAICRICNDEILRERLLKGGLATAKNHDWKNLEESICDLYR